jgi:hypothetical protein
MKRIDYELPIYFSGSIIDIETSGLNEKTEEITCCGILTKDKIIQICPEEPIGLDIDELVTKIESYKMFEPYYAFYKNMEERFLGIRIHEEINKLNSFGKYISKHDIITVAPFMSGDILDGVGKECVEEWNKYKETKNFSHMNTILAHNKSCLLQELILVLYGECI